MSTDQSPEPDVLPTELHRLRAGAGPTAAEWCLIPGSSARVRVAITGQVLLVEGASEVPVPASPAALPLRTRSVDRIALPLVLPLQPEPEVVLAEARRVLAPHGLLSVLVPAPPSFGWRGGALRRAVRDGWRHPSCVDHPDWLAASAEFAVLADDRLTFSPDAGPVDVEALCRAGIYPPGLPADVRSAIAGHRSATRGVRLRRVVARR
ncbi:class I SAM-dependent methyltransferase [Pseudonocardia nantongensis]|uniref:class I SAM-dependent methyltransferase n=1 Tax=Pseudonocardia nantongensis TaxID=1181885 RepID=UPI00397AE825